MRGIIRILICICTALAYALIAHQSMGQGTCELVLTQAQDEFNAGRFYSVPGLLQECLAKNQNREWKQRAYLLLAETYLLLENSEKADESYLNVLRANPEFVTDASRDPIDLVYLSKKFTATPVFSFHGKMGLNTSFIRVIHDVKISSQNSTLEEYALRVGWQAGFGLDYHYNESWALGTELNYAFTSFSHSTNNLFLAGRYTVDFTDRQTWISVPLLIRYTKTENILRPFAYAGYTFNLLVRDRADMVIDGDTESPVFNFLDKRSNFMGAVIVGAGLKYKWGLRYFFADLRYSLGFNNLAKPSNRYNEVNQSWPYVDDDFRMDNIFLSVGYIHPFYKARKLKKARTKSALRKIRRR